MRMMGSIKPSSRAETSRLMYDLAEELFPYCRSITGDGLRKTLLRIQKELPELIVHAVPSGTACFDWVVPDEWNISSATLTAPDGTVVADFQSSNLHVVNYSVPVDMMLSLTDLQSHLYSIPEQSDAIPYVTTYFDRQWGFCLTERVRKSLKDGIYHAKIESTLSPGELNYGELFIPGRSPEEILISVNVCHPSMANNELSGPVLATYLAKALVQRDKRRFSYRFVFVPETIGAIAFISANINTLREKVIAGFVLTCIGDDRCYSYLASRKGDTYTDRVAKHVLQHIDPNFITYSYLDRGSDERQYCAPGVDLPVVVLTRSKFRTYPEYHTSLDDMGFISPKALGDSLAMVEACIDAIEDDEIFRATMLCEVQLGRRGLYKEIRDRTYEGDPRLRMDILAYCDGENSLLDIADLLDRPISDIVRCANELREHGLLETAQAPD